MENERKKLVYSVAEAAVILSLSEQGCYDAVRRKQIPHIKFGKRIAIPCAALHKMLGISGDAEVGKGQLYSVAEAAVILGLSKQGCYDAIHRGEVPHIQFGTRIAIPCAALHKMLGISGDAEGGTGQHRVGGQLIGPDDEAGCAAVV